MFKTLPFHHKPNEHLCGTSMMQDLLLSNSRAMEEKRDSIEAYVYASFIQKYSVFNTDTFSKRMLYTIPFVMHVIHDNGSENISDATVIKGIQDLNDAFRNVGAYLPSTGVDVEIEFCLARQDENPSF